MRYPIQTIIKHNSPLSQRPPLIDPAFEIQFGKPLRYLKMYIINNMRQL